MALSASKQRTFPVVDNVNTMMLLGEANIDPTEPCSLKLTIRVMRTGEVDRDLCIQYAVSQAAFEEVLNLSRLLHQFEQRPFQSHLRL